MIEDPEKLNTNLAVFCHDINREYGRGTITQTIDGKQGSFKKYNSTWIFFLLNIHTMQLKTELQQVDIVWKKIDIYIVIYNHSDK